MKPKTLQQAIQHFSNEQTCIDTVAFLRWPDGKPECPKCGGKEQYYLATQKRWKCKNGKCGKQFSVKVGTIFEDSPIGLDKWLMAMWMIAACKNGISSYEIHRAIGVTQKSAWFMMHRIRLAMQDWKKVIKSGSLILDSERAYEGCPCITTARTADTSSVPGVNAPVTVRHKA